MLVVYLLYESSGVHCKLIMFCLFPIFRAVLRYYACQVPIYLLKVAALVIGLVVLVSLCVVLTGMLLGVQ